MLSVVVLINFAEYPARIENALYIHAMVFFNFVGSSSHWCYIWCTSIWLSGRQVGQEVLTCLLWGALSVWLPRPQLCALYEHCIWIQGSSYHWEILHWSWYGMGWKCRSGTSNLLTILQLHHLVTVLCTTI